MFDSLNNVAAPDLPGRQVIDESSEAIGTVDGVWLDPSSQRVEFVGVKSSWLSGKVHVVPAAVVQLVEGRLRLPYPTAFIKRAPAVRSQTELAQVDKEEINAYYGRFISVNRVNSIEQIRPEEAVDPLSGKESDLTGEDAPSNQDRAQIEGAEQAFFNQQGFVTDAMPEVNASKELLRVQEEAKTRNREDRKKTGSTD
jgi:sporulation protein YlmC with PRC-barrel domain